jgi:uncharacterized protein YydD (DUF2326 family)
MSVDAGHLEIAFHNHRKITKGLKISHIPEQKEHGIKCISLTHVCLRFVIRKLLGNILAQQ